MATDWHKLSTHAKIADLVRNSTGVLEALCRQMEKNKSEDPCGYLKQMKHRIDSLSEGLTLIEAKIDEKTNQK